MDPIAATATGRFAFDEVADLEIRDVYAREDAFRSEGALWSR
jgi:hypothetical protein